MSPFLVSRGDSHSPSIFKTSKWKLPFLRNSCLSPMTLLGTSPQRDLHPSMAVIAWHGVAGGLWSVLPFMELETLLCIQLNSLPCLNHVATLLCIPWDISTLWPFPNVNFFFFINTLSHPKVSALFYYLFSGPTMCSSEILFVNWSSSISSKMFLPELKHNNNIYFLPPQGSVAVNNCEKGEKVKFYTACKLKS